MFWSPADSLWDVLQVEAPPTAAPEKQKAPVDPFDAASILRSAESVAPPQAVFIRPEVTEHIIVAEKGYKCGERDDTLPPRYRYKNMVRDGAFLRVGDRVYNVIREGEGQMNCLRSSTVRPAESSIEPGTVGKREEGKENESEHGGAASQLELHHNKPSALYPSDVSQYGKQPPDTAQPKVSPGSPYIFILASRERGWGGLLHRPSNVTQPADWEAEPEPLRHVVLLPEGGTASSALLVWFSGGANLCGTMCLKAADAVLKEKLSVSVALDNGLAVSPKITDTPPLPPSTSTFALRAAAEQASALLKEANPSHESRSRRQLPRNPPALPAPLLRWLQPPAETKLGLRCYSPTLSCGRLHQTPSQPSRTAPKPAAQVSRATPAQSEKESSGSAMASKPGVVTRATGGATGSGATAGGSALTGTAGKVTAKAKAE
ncbi:hypothetical protein D4764_04G0003780, partial [Takifugu flavidus]